MSDAQLEAVAAAIAKIAYHKHGLETLNYAGEDDFCKRESHHYMDDAKAAITAIQPFIRQGWQPRYGFPRDGMDIVRSALLEKNVYLQGKNGDVYRVWLDHLGVPMIECVEFNAALPEPPKEPNPDNQPKE